MSIIERNGYGNAFNKIYIEGDILYKSAKNEYGRKKLEKEYNFYLHVKAVGLDFLFPEGIEFNGDILHMKYYKNTTPFYKIYWNSSSTLKECYLERVSSFLKTLHQSSRQSVSQEVLQRDLYDETFTKVMSRYDEVKEIINQYDIQSVNHINLLSFEELMSYIQKKIHELTRNIHVEYCLIHGDCQFSNLLYNAVTDEFICIDPRGYFGKSEIYGLPEYDFAKLLFALTGYDILDSITVETLTIIEGNLEINSIPMEKNIFREVRLEHILLVSIWLANAHCFKDQPAKAALSHFYARYVGTLVYMSDKSLMK